jgi:transmembrane sensor
MDGQVDDGDEVRAQAAEWFARLKTVPVSRETLEQFFEWRRIEAHGAAFEAVERVWSIAGEASGSPAITAAVATAYDRGGEGTARRSWKGPLAIAGALLAGGAGLSVLLMNHGQHYETQVGEQRTVSLEDGSRLTLDTDTSLTVRYSRANRRITLDHGQAFFSVAHARDRPFLVDAAGAEVLATGTEFEVRRIGVATEVTLVEGKVEITSPRVHEVRQLVSGERYRVTGEETPVVRRVDTAADTAWRRGRIVFDETSLATAVAEVNRYTKRPITLASQTHADNRLSGSFETGDIDGFLAAATTVLPLRVERGTDGAVRLVDATGPGKN